MSYRRFEETTTILGAYKAIELPVKTDLEQIRRVADSFNKNMERVVAFSSLPLALIDAAWIEGRKHVQPGKNSDLVRLVGQTDDTADRMSEVLARAIDGGVAANRERIERGFDAMLSGIVIGSWTAFESLATDLWVESVNAYPWGLAELRGQRLSDEGQRDQETADDDSQTKTEKYVRLDMLQRHGYDINKKMGEILKQKFNHSLFEGIWNAYRVAWARELDFDPVFKCRDLKTLYALRNVLAHRGGIADDKFLVRTKGDVRFASVERNDPVPIDGVLAKDLAFRAIDCSVQLFKTVDEWLSVKLAERARN